MSVEKEREIGSHLGKQRCHVVVVIVDGVVHHSVASAETVASQVNEVHVKAVQSVLNCTF